MKAFIFYNSSVGDKVIVQQIQDQLNCEIELINNRVDLSKITPEAHNVIIVINRNIINFDFFRFMGRVVEDLSKPLIVVKKLKTFGALSFSDDFKVKSIETNKLYPFAGIIYIPQKNFYNTMSDIFKSIDLKEVRHIVVKARS